jgi:heme/copper-type cytochrome/quinol oxidase subunit 2
MNYKLRDRTYPTPAIEHNNLTRLTMLILGTIFLVVFGLIAAFAIAIWG